MARESIYLQGFAHVNPVPAACRIGDLLVSGVLTGKDPSTKLFPLSLDEQVINVFARVRELMSLAGGSTDDIIKVTFWVQDYRERAAINLEWIAMFPDETDRPARQIMAAQLDNGALLQCDLMARIP